MLRPHRATVPMHQARDNTPGCNSTQQSAVVFERHIGFEHLIAAAIACYHSFKDSRNWQHSGFTRWGPLGRLCKMKHDDAHLTTSVSNGGM